MVLCSLYYFTVSFFIVFLLVMQLFVPPSYFILFKRVHLTHRVKIFIPVDFYFIALIYECVTVTPNSPVNCSVHSSIILRSTLPFALILGSGPLSPGKGGFDESAQWKRFQLSAQ